MTDKPPTCPITGQPLPPRAEGARGRARIYYSDDARALAGWLEAVTESLKKVAPDMTPEAKVRMRARLFGMMNQGALRPTAETYRRAQARGKK